MLRAKLAQIAPPSVQPSAVLVGWTEFASYLARKRSITGDLLSQAAPGRDKKLRELWELTELSAHDFAEEVGQFLQASAGRTSPASPGHVSKRTVFSPLLAGRGHLSLPAWRGRHPYFGCFRSHRHEQRTGR